MKIKNIEIYELEIPFSKFVGDNGTSAKGFAIQRQVFDFCIVKMMEKCWPAASVQSMRVHGPSLKQHRKNPSVQTLFWEKHKNT